MNGYYLLLFISFILFSGGVFSLKYKKATFGRLSLNVYTGSIAQLIGFYGIILGFLVAGFSFQKLLNSQSNFFYILLDVFFGIIAGIIFFKTNPIKPLKKGYYGNKVLTATDWIYIILGLMLFFSAFFAKW